MVKTTTNQPLNKSKHGDLLCWPPKRFGRVFCLSGLAPDEISSQCRAFITHDHDLQLKLPHMFLGNRYQSLRPSSRARSRCFDLLLDRGWTCPVLRNKMCPSSLVSTRRCWPQGLVDPANEQRWWWLEGGSGFGRMRSFLRELAPW